MYDAADRRFKDSNNDLEDVDEYFKQQMQQLNDEGYEISEYICLSDLHNPAAGRCSERRPRTGDGYRSSAAHERCLRRCREGCCPGGLSR